MEENINVYQRFQPHQQLLPYIDSYWMVKTKKIDSLTYKKMPNGLTDILFIIGEDFIADNGNTRLKNGNVFFAGLKTNAVEITRQSHVDILGISMKAGAFASFFPFGDLANTTNKIVEIGYDFVPSFKFLFNEKVIANLDSFFLNRLSPEKNLLLEIVNEIDTQNGQIKVSMIPLKYPITARNLERRFKDAVGLSPKEYINLVRFRAANETIKTQYPAKSLLEIAFDCGYYDHSHLCNDFRKYTGFTPSQL